MSCDAAAPGEPAFACAFTYRAGGMDRRLEIATPAPLVALVGRSGIGKTSALDCIAGLARPRAGRIAIAGRVLFDDAAGIDLPPQDRRAGYVFQDGRLFPHLTVRRNLAYGRALAPVAERFMEVGEAADLLGIAPLLDRRPRTLSGGEARRVAIGRALLAGPRFLLMDEPLTSLDPERADGILDAIARIRDSLALPILYVSHAPAEVARLTDTVVRLD